MRTAKNTFNDEMCRYLFMIHSLDRTQSVLNCLPTQSICELQIYVLIMSVMNEEVIYSSDYNSDLNVTNEAKNIYRQYLTVFIGTIPYLITTTDVISKPKVTVD